MDSEKMNKKWVLPLVLIAGAGQAQECLDYRTELLPQVAFLPTSCTLNVVDASDSHLCYVRTEETEGQRVIYWCDISGDGTPTPLGQIVLDGTTVKVLRVSGSRVAALHSDGTWQVVEFADPANPALIGSMGTERPCRDLDLNGNFVFAVESSGIGIYELMTDGPPQERSRFAAPPSAYPPNGTSRVVSLDVEETRCWAILDDANWLDHFPTLIILDVSDPLAPTVSSSRTMHACLYGACSFGATIRADGRRAVLSNAQMGYTAIFQLSDSSKIDIDMTMDDDGCGWRLNGDWAYRTDRSRLTYFHFEEGVWREAGSWSCQGSTIAASSTGVWIGSPCYPAGITSYRPQLATDLQPGATVYDPPERAGTLISAGRRLLLSEWSWSDEHGYVTNWLSVLDGENSPELAKTHELAYTPCRNCLVFAASDSFVYSNGGVWDLDTGARVNAGTFNGLATIGTALWCRGEGGLDVYDLADPVAPRLTGTCFSPLYSYCVATSGERAVIAAVNQLLVIDIGDPLAPVELSRTAHIQDHVYGIWMKANAVYLSYNTNAAPYGGFEVFRINDDGSLSQTPTFFNPGLAAQDLVLDGSLMYMVSLDGLRIFDVTDPTVPVEIGARLDHSWLTSVALLGDFVYANDKVEISTSGPGLVRVFPRQCPISVPVALRDLAVRWIERAVHISWTMDLDLISVRVLARTAGREWVVPWQVRNGQWEAVDQQAPPGQTVMYEIQAVIDDHWSTLAEQSLTVPAVSLTLEDPIPNPFNPVTELRYTLGDAGIVELAIFDTAGRRLCTLASGRQGAGAHAVTWRGLDDTGRQMPAGVYLARLSTSHGVRSVKLTLLQ